MGPLWYRNAPPRFKDDSNARTRRLGRGLM